MEHRNILLSRNEAGTDGYASQCIHNLGYIYLVGAPSAAGVAGSAEPYGLRCKNLVTMAILDMPEHLVGKDVHGEIDGTSCRTFLALVAVLNFLSAFLKDLRQQGIIRGGCLRACVHSITPVLGSGDIPGRAERSTSPSNNLNWLY